MDITIGLVFFGVGLGLIIFLFLAEQLVKGVVGTSIRLASAFRNLR